MKQLIFSAIAFVVIFAHSHLEAATVEKVTFISADQTLVGNLYLPDSYQQGEVLNGVIITGAWTTVKEQMPATYAEAMAERGFAALTFDFRGWGESQDEIPYLENPQRKIEDIKAAAKYLASRPEVKGSVGGIGICASAGYMSDAALNNPDIAAVSLIAPWLHDQAIVEAVYGGKEGVAGLIEVGREAEKSSSPVIIEAASMTNDQSLMFKAPYYTEADRGLIPAYDNKFNVASWEGWLNFDAQKTAALQDTPILMVHSEAAAIPMGVKQYAEAMGKNVDVIWLDNVTQFEFYDRADAVKTSSDATAKHFKGLL